MLKPLRKKGFPLYYEIAELVDGTRATGQNAFRAGQPPATPAPTQNAVASASTSYEPVIDPELLNISLEMGGASDEAPEEINTSVVVSRRSIYEREMESLISTVRSIHYPHINILTSARMRKLQSQTSRKKGRERLFRSGLHPPGIPDKTGAKCVGSL